MDTKTLVVGQDVYARSYTQYFEAKVVKVTSSGVEVQTDCGTLLRFDNEGKECDGNGTHGLLECGPIRDTRTLVVGQEVYMFCGHYSCCGKVVKVTPEGIEVQNGDIGFLRFDSKGKGYYIDMNRGYDDCPGPWYIDDMPFTAKKPQ